MTLEEYKDLFLVHFVHLSHPEYGLIEDLALSNAQIYKTWHWNGRFPKSDREVKVAYESYKAFAEEDQDFVCTGKLQILLTAALKKLDAAREYALSHLVDCWPHTVEGTASANDCDTALKCQTPLVAQSGDLLFDCVAECLVSAGNNIESPRLDCAFQEVFTENWFSPWWERLDLAKTKSLEIRQLPCISAENLWSFDRSQVDAFVGSMLSKSHQSHIGIICIAIVARIFANRIVEIGEWHGSYYDGT